MKHTLVMAALAAAIIARGQDLTRAEVKSPDDISALAAIPEWRSGGTNGITVSVCTGMMIIKDRANWKWCVPLARTLEFDTEGRLIKASAIKIIGGSFEDSQYQTPESVRKAYFPTDAEQAERDKRMKRLELMRREAERKAFEEALRKSKEEREARRTNSQMRTQGTPAPPTRPPLSEKSSGGGK